MTKIWTDMDGYEKSKSQYTTVISAPFDWNDSMAEHAMEAFESLEIRMPYQQSQFIGLALSKLQLLEQNGEKITFYRFPHLKKFDNLCPLEYRDKIDEECAEVIHEFDACHSESCKYCNDECDFCVSPELIGEVLDLMQACETFLRNSGYSEAAIREALEVHNEKDAERDYDKVVEK